MRLPSHDLGRLQLRDLVRGEAELGQYSLRLSSNSGGRAAILFGVRDSVTLAEQADVTVLGISFNLKRRADAIALQPFDSRNARLHFENALVSYRLILPIACNAFSKSLLPVFSRSSIVKNTSYRAARIRLSSKWHSARIRDCSMRSNSLLPSAKISAKESILPFTPGSS